MGGGRFPSYRAQDGPRGEWAYLRPTNLIAQHKIEKKVCIEWASLVGLEREGPLRNPKGRRDKRGSAKTRAV